MKKILMAVALLAGTILLAAPATQAVDTAENRTTENRKVCTARVLDKAAFDEVVPGTPGRWWNWSPNRSKGPFEGPPAFPTDSRGTWQGPHTNGGPAGTGTYQMGNGHGSWFHREAATAARTIHHKATFKTVVVPCGKVPEKKIEPASAGTLPQSGA